ncbi:hypothetical protein Ac2012v2_007981 [Leucoagaricus gongylophorus]
MQLLRQFCLHTLTWSFLFLQVLGQNSVQTFGWRFRTDFMSVNLPSCFNFSLVVFPNPQNATAGNYSGTPPYYMMAFPEGGQPLTTLVGVSNDTLSWLPQHPVGTRLILQIVDSLGNTGGTGSSIYEVAQTVDFTNCIVPAPSQDFRISSNITEGGTLETCRPWRLDIDGGHPPYTVVLDARNSPVMTNITIPSTDNAMVYINRATPGTDLFGDSGRWATGTQYVSTVGSTDVTCTGLGTASFNQTILNQQEAARRAAQNSRRRTSIIIGVVVSLVSLLSITLNLANLTSSDLQIKPSLLITSWNQASSLRPLLEKPGPSLLAHTDHPIKRSLILRKSSALITHGNHPEQAPFHCLSMILIRTVSQVLSIPRPYQFAVPKVKKPRK